MKSFKIDLYKTAWLTIAAVIIIIQFFAKLGFGDDVPYSTVLSDKSLLVFLKDRYRWWSSRVVIEAIMVPLLYMPPIVWRLLNGLSILLGIVLIEKSFFTGNKYIGRIIFSCIMFTIPILSVKSAGWITTTTNYLWAFSLGMVAIYSLRLYIEKKQSLAIFLLSIPAIIYAANMEQMAALLLGAFIVAGLYLLVRRQRIPWMYLIQLGIIICSLIFILRSQGNDCRAAYEMERYFPLFNDLSIFEKLYMGFLVTSRYYFAKEEGTWVFLLFACILLLKVFIRQKKWWKRAISTLPLLSLFALSLLELLWRNGILTRGLRPLEVIWHNNSVAAVSGYSEHFVLLQGILYLVIWLCIFPCIHFVNDTLNASLLEWTLLLAGLTSRIIMGFSPTLYASGDRTSLFASIALLIITMRHIPAVGSKLKHCFLTVTAKARAHTQK